MSYPTPLNISYSYTGFATGLGDASFPGTQLDADLANVELSVDELLTFIQTSFTAEGVLKVAAMPTASDLVAFVGNAEEAATAAAASAVDAAASQTAAALSASGASASAASASATLAGAALKASNLSDLASAATARTNLGLGSLATKSAIASADIGDGAVTAAKVDVGALVQRAYASTGAVDTTAATIPNDNTIPQNTEGKEFLTVSITPKSATNILRVTTELNLSPSASTFMIVALFRDSTADAFAAGGQSGSGASEVRRIVLTHEVVAGSTSATTFRVRAGNGGSGTLTLNGNGGSRLFGGVLISSIRVDEIKA